MHCARASLGERVQIRGDEKMRRFLQSLFRGRVWPNTKKNYESEIDLFLKDFNARRTVDSLSRQQEREKHADIAARRDHVVEDPKSDIWL